ncbi:ATP-binding cassette domain-containing protein [Ferdinandcohnia quinoae]|uniref:UvrABC system protein A n=1 Tax=Fredinandcohnia quinoae TaxID=2918902 RepID=A0AAW5E3D9_9BACI|nr:excinuclease ABC subunit UvrA [Fredinandcohnia sp. SECRCQ15]MCH1624412.1 excinuclease ABC subunit UvrA [Fredinandcohnia sp. SECRCQ15]
MTQEYIELINARENNLKHVNLQIPKGKITIFTGVSGSGKSSIVFDTIAQEAGRQLNETFSSFARQFLPKYSRPEADEINNLSTAIVVDQKRLGGNARSTLGTATDINPLMRLLFSRFAEPQIGYTNAYSFNDPIGMCPKCEGLGKIITLNTDAAIDMDKSLNEGAILLSGFGPGTWQWKAYAESGFFDNDKKIKDYTKEEFDKLVYAEQEKVKVDYMGKEMNTTYEGLAVKFMRQNVNREKDTTKAAAKKLKDYTTTRTCPSCEGTRYNEKVMSSTYKGYSIYDLTSIQLDELIEVLQKIDEPNAKPIIDGIVERLKNLCEIGLGYLTLTRETPTLSGGESQRVKMVKYLSSNLTGLMYIFDEPSTGLHPRDVYRLNELLVKLRDKGNTILVVEHDPDVIQIADHIIDVGPKAGARGGNIMYSGSYEGLLASDTLTGNYLNRKSERKAKPRPVSDFLVSRKSSLHNLKDESLRIPTGVFTSITGVAGSGKSTLVNKVFAKDFPEAIRIDQSPVHANIRSNPATFSGIMDAIRKAFSDENKVESGLFSYNSKGACETCGGTGSVQLNLSFMDVMEVECSECKGDRFKQDVLKYLYKGKNIVEIMEMSVTEALEFFEVKSIQTKLKSMETVGLGYLSIGQPLSTLSGGECQRLKLAKELGTKGSIYILDEPTTGLHMSDVSTILNIIDKLVEKGNTVVVIEHNLDVIRHSDWIIDLGPDGGAGGGEILYEGPPAGILDCERSVTAKYI